MNVITDIHTHTTFSADGISTMEEMLEQAVKLGVRYLGISEHFDYDYAALALKVNGKLLPEIDAERYFTTGRAFQTAYQDKLTLLLGCEFGFHDTKEVTARVQKTIATYHPDFVVNSVHTCLGRDCWFPDYFENKTKTEAYTAYLSQIEKSLDADYPYDIIAHLGYCARNATYADPKLRYVEFQDILDRILRKIIQKEKILEVNSSSRTAGSAFLPDADILTAYYEFGGRKVSFSSDAHNTERLCEKRELVVSALKQIGFTHLTVPCRGEEIQIEL